MADFILIGRGDTIVEISAERWRQHLAQTQRHSFSFMTSDHHLIRNFVVSELPCNQGNPLRPEDIAQRLRLPLSRVSTILEELQKHLFFLVRNQAGEVSWAFPVTVERTPHQLSFNTGERVFAA
jgi:hypothetical protein